MIYIMAIIFIIICLSAMAGNSGVKHHDSRHDRHYQISHRNNKKGVK